MFGVYQVVLYITVTTIQRGVVHRTLFKNGSNRPWMLGLYDQIVNRSIKVYRCLGRGRPCQDTDIRFYTHVVIWLCLGRRVHPLATLYSDVMHSVDRLREPVGLSTAKYGRDFLHIRVNIGLLAFDFHSWWRDGTFDERLNLAHFLRSSYPCIHWKHQQTIVMILQSIWGLYDRHRSIPQLERSFEVKTTNRGRTG